MLKQKRSYTIQYLPLCYLLFGSFVVQPIITLLLYQNQNRQPKFFLVCKETFSFFLTKFCHSLVFSTVTPKCFTKLAGKRVDFFRLSAACASPLHGSAPGTSILADDKQVLSLIYGSSFPALFSIFQLISTAFDCS